MLRFIDSIRELLLLYLVVLLASAGGYALLEHKPFLDSFWWACMTATTVGYGDTYPTTFGGKLIAVILIHLTLLFILPLLIGRICSQFIKDQNAFTHDEQEDLKAALRRLEERLDRMAVAGAEKDK
jgi:voltage-gated potassium channel